MSQLAGPGSAASSAARANRIATLSTAAFVATLGLVTLLALDRVNEGKINDFYGYWDAARTAIEGRPLAEAWGMVWMPLLTYAIVPLGFMPLLVAAAAWTLANALIAAGLCHIAAEAAVRARGTPTDPATIPVVRLIALAVMLPPIRNVIYEGQFDLLLALLCTAAIGGIARGARALPAIGIVAAAIVKWSSVALLPWIAARRPLCALWTIVAAGCAALAPALVMGADECMTQLRRALAGPVAASDPYVTMPDRWSLTNGLGRIADVAGLNPQSGRWTAIAICALIAAAFLWQYRCRGVRWFGTRARGSCDAVRRSLLLAEGAAFMAVPLAVHPHVATRHATVMTLPIAILAATAIARVPRQTAQLAGIGLVIMAITWYVPYPMRAWWQWVGGPAAAALAAASIALWTQLPQRTRALPNEHAMAATSPA